jgi:hypothetical protein
MPAVKTELIQYLDLLLPWVVVVVVVGLVKLATTEDQAEAAHQIPAILDKAYNNLAAVE